MYNVIFPYLLIADFVFLIAYPLWLKKHAGFSAASCGSAIFGGLDCEVLEDLKLNGNKIVDLGPLWELTGLVELDVSYNKIRRLPPQPFDGLSHLWGIDLYCNPLALEERKEVLKRYPELRILVDNLDEEEEEEDEL